ncbi:MAG: hypothetical protein CFE45_18060 [Burkholderiales bacterium PBB5]|jgi:hypothetical protein|nr:MAG: hypothetical protein CFE45_18060 [Burkholderiales bacterium PBB5]
MKILIVLALIGVLVALASAGLFMLRKGGDTRSRDSRMAKALAVRVGVSVALFLFILFSWYMGWVQPTGLPTGR